MRFYTKGNTTKITTNKSKKEFTMKNEIAIKVTYVGHDDFTNDFPKSVILHSIKIRAMKSFELEEGSADKYVLQLNGIDMDDKSHLESLGTDEIVFTLMLKEEVTKG
jgi:hypothetical protein